MHDCPSMEWGGQGLKNGIRDTRRRCRFSEEGHLCADRLVVIVSTALEEVLDTLGGDVDFQSKGISCVAPKEALDTLQEDVNRCAREVETMLL